jgi:hypothetical protein
LAYGTGLSRATLWVTQSDDFLVVLVLGVAGMGFYSTEKSALPMRSRFWRGNGGFPFPGAV